MNTAVQRKPIQREGPESPSWLRRLGLARDEELAKQLKLDPGRYFTEVKQRLEYVMHGPVGRDGRQIYSPRERMRAWFALATNAIGSIEHSTSEKTGAVRYHGRCAMKLVRQNGKLVKVPASPQDAADKCTGTGMALSLVSRTITEMVEVGEARRVGRAHPGSKVALFFYLHWDANRKTSKTSVNSQIMVSDVGNHSGYSGPITFALSVPYRINGSSGECKLKVQIEPPMFIDVGKRRFIKDQAPMVFQKSLERLLAAETTDSIDVTNAVTTESTEAGDSFSGAKTPPAKTSDPVSQTLAHLHAIFEQFPRSNLRQHGPPDRGIAQRIVKALGPRSVDDFFRNFVARKFKDGRTPHYANGPQRWPLLENWAKDFSGLK